MTLRRHRPRGAGWSSPEFEQASRVCDRRTIKQIQAQEHLQPATTMYREMDMNFWLAQAEAALGSRG